MSLWLQELARPGKGAVCGIGCLGVEWGELHWPPHGPPQTTKTTPDWVSRLPRLLSKKPKRNIVVVVAGGAKDSRKKCCTWSVLLGCGKGELHWPAYCSPRPQIPHPNGCHDYNSWYLKNTKNKLSLWMWELETPGKGDVCGLCCLGVERASFIGQPLAPPRPKIPQPNGRQDDHGWYLKQHKHQFVSVAGEPQTPGKGAVCGICCLGAEGASFIDQPIVPPRPQIQRIGWWCVCV